MLDTKNLVTLVFSIIISGSISEAKSHKVTWKSGDPQVTGYRIGYDLIGEDEPCNTQSDTQVEFRHWVNVGNILEFVPEDDPVFRLGFRYRIGIYAYNDTTAGRPGFHGELRSTASNIVCFNLYGAPPPVQLDEMDDANDYGIRQGSEAEDGQVGREQARNENGSENDDHEIVALGAVKPLANSQTPSAPSGKLEDKGSLFSRGLQAVSAANAPLNSEEELNANSSNSRIEFAYNTEGVAESQNAFEQNQMDPKTNRRNSKTSPIEGDSRIRQLSQAVQHVLSSEPKGWLWGSICVLAVLAFLLRLSSSRPSMPRS